MDKHLEEILRRHKRVMRMMALVFTGCIALIVLTVVLVLNNFPFYVWMPVFMLVLVGQWWLANGGRWSRKGL